MSHLVSYENAEGPVAKALTALDVANAKSAVRSMWFWADTARDHAEEAGLAGAVLDGIFGDGREPDTSALRSLLLQFQKQVTATPVETFTLYEEADGHVAKAICSLRLAGHQKTAEARWEWAQRGAEHARTTGIADAVKLLGDGQMPKTEKLLRRLERLQEFERKSCLDLSTVTAEILAGTRDGSKWAAGLETRRAAICRGE